MTTATLDKDIKSINEIPLAVYKPEKDCDEDDRKVRALEKHKCKGSFVYFLKYVKVIKPPTQDDPGGLIQFKFWPHLIEAINLILNQKLFIWLKSRQIGASWLIAAYVLWYAMSHIGAKVLLFSKGEVEAMELLAKCYVIYNNLPDFMQLKQDPKSLTEVGFPVMNSSIKVLAATKTAGVSFTASILVCDEWQDHPFAEENYFAAKPTIDGGGQFIGIFTQSGETLETFANITFVDAMEKKNDFAWLFSGWQVVPNRTQKWYESTKRNIPREKLHMLTPELYMQRNYPATVQEALRPLQTSAAFNLATIEAMMADTRNSILETQDAEGRILVVKDGIDSNIVKLYKDFNLGQYFIAATDTSHGLGMDFSVTVIMNVKTGDVVADIMDSKVPPEELAFHSIRLLEIFKNPLWFIEANDYGGITISTAKKLNYLALGYQDDKKTKEGFITHESNRPLLWGDLIPAINNRQITIYNKDGLRQFSDVIRNAAKNGRIEAMSGRHDDYPFAVGIAWLKKGGVTVEEINAKPIHSLTFGNRSNKWWRR